MKERKREILNLVAHCQMASVTKAGPIQSQQPEDSSRSTMRVHRFKDLGHLKLLFQTHHQGTELEVEQLGFKLAPILDIDTKGCSFSC